MIIEIRKIALELKVKLPDLITRPLGRKMFGKVKNLLSHAGEKEVVILDLTGIKVMDSSFIDEFLLQLLRESRRPEGGFFIKLRNVPDIAENNIDSMLVSYHSYSDEKIAVVTDRITMHNSNFLGILSQRERDILDFLRVNKTASAEDIASLINASVLESERLADVLYSLRVIRREETSRGLRYSSL